MNSGLYSSATCEWATPADFFQKIEKRFGPFDLDVCASADNKKARVFFTKEDNGLSKRWEGLCWMNPPYGREIGLWMRKAYLSCVENSATVVCLVPARTDTNWWHGFAMKGEVEFIKGRLKFGAGKNTAPFPSALVVFRPQTIEENK